MLTRELVAMILLIGVIVALVYSSSCKSKKIEALIESVAPRSGSVRESVKLDQERKKLKKNICLGDNSRRC